MHVIARNSKIQTPFDFYMTANNLLDFNRFQGYSTFPLILLISGYQHFSVLGCFELRPRAYKDFMEEDRRTHGNGYNSEYDMA